MDISSDYFTRQLGFNPRGEDDDSTHIRPTSFETLAHDNIPAGTPISFQYADSDGEDWNAIRGTLEHSMLIAIDETGRVMPIEDVRLRDATGVHEIQCDIITDFQTLEDEAVAAVEGPGLYEALKDLLLSPTFEARCKARAILFLYEFDHDLERTGWPVDEHDQPEKED